MHCVINKSNGSCKTGLIYINILDHFSLSYEHLKYVLVALKYTGESD